MKNIALKLLFLLNYIFIILYISRYLTIEQSIIENSIPLFLSSLMLIDITYISVCNIRENKVISLFCGLLALDSWYVLLSFEKDIIESFIFNILSPIIWYVSIKFILMFLFQRNGYKFQKTVNRILLITCFGSLISIGISSQMYACLYGIQFFISWLCFLFIIIYHRKQITFVLKSERNCILFSVTIITILFLIYYFATIEVKNHISNFGIYLPMFLFLMSVHGILLKEHSSYPLSTVFNKAQTILIISLSLTTIGLIILFTGSSYKELLIAVNALFCFIYICNIILGQNIKDGESKIIKESNYNAAMRQLKQEELLKTDFANFLHDDILQDLLSIKNMMTKAYRTDIQDIIIETLNNLNAHIREQMQDYHPAILKNLTIKENYLNLIKTISQSFPQKNIMISFECSDTLFLVEPYNVLIYRILKELLTNVYKHSNGNRTWVTLIQEKSKIELCVSDNGTANINCLTLADSNKHKGIVSIAEQVNNIEGSMVISENTPHGICVQITIPMKGEGSYQHFISR